MKRAACLLLMVATYMKAAPMKVHIVTDVPSPQPVGPFWSAPLVNWPRFCLQDRSCREIGAVHAINDSERL